LLCVLFAKIMQLKDNAKHLPFFYFFSKLFLALRAV
jgi:hypothetical protein